MKLSISGVLCSHRADSAHEHSSCPCIPTPGWSHRCWGLCSSPMLVSVVLGMPPACPAMFWPTQPSPQSPNLTSTGFLKQLRSYTELLMTSFWVDAFPLSGSQRMWATLMQSAVIPSCHCLLFWTIAQMASFFSEHEELFTSIFILSSKIHFSSHTLIIKYFFLIKWYFCNFG